MKLCKTLAHVCKLFDSMARDKFEGKKRFEIPIKRISLGTLLNVLIYKVKTYQPNNAKMKWNAIEIPTKTKIPSATEKQGPELQKKNGQNTTIAALKHHAKGRKTNRKAAQEDIEVITDRTWCHPGSNAMDSCCWVWEDSEPVSKCWCRRDIRWRHYERPHLLMHTQDEDTSEGAHKGCLRTWLAYKWRETWLLSRQWNRFCVSIRKSECRLRGRTSETYEFLKFQRRVIARVLKHNIVSRFGCSERRIVALKEEAEPGRINNSVVNDKTGVEILGGM